MDNTRRKVQTMKHEHEPYGLNTMDYTTRERKRYQWSNCKCGAELRRETLPSESRQNWTEWQNVKELGV